MAGKIDVTRWTLIGAAGVTAGILGVSLSLLIFGPPGAGAGVEGGGRALIGGPFELVDQNGQTVSEEILLGKPHLVYFGYTFCPDVCPMEVNSMSIAEDILEERGLDVGLVFVSVDPARDTPEAMTEFLSYFDEDFIGLSGSEEQVAAAAKAYRAFYRVVPNEESPKDYLVDHSSFIYAMDERGDYRTHFGIGTEPEQIADTVASLAAGS